MPMRVTMLQSRRGEGVDLVAGNTYTVSDAFGASLVQNKFATDTDGALQVPNSFPATFSRDPLTGEATGISAGGVVFNMARGTPILNGASAGADSGWLPLSDAPERFMYQLDTGTTTTTFSVDISADGSTSLGQALTGTWASSTVAEITFPIMFSNPLAKFFRWNVISGGPLSVSRGA